MKEGWEVKQFGDVCEIIGGSQPPKKEFIFEPREGYVRLVQVRDYKTDKYITYIPKEKTKKFCSSEDIMIGRYGPPIFGIFSGIEGAYNVALMKAVPDLDQLNKDFFKWFLKTNHLLKFVEKSSKRAAGQDGVRKEVLYTYPVPVPPLAEQEAIVEVLDKAFAAIDQAKANLELNIANAKELFQSKLNQIFSQKGEGWVEKKLAEIIKVKHGFAFRSKFFTTEGDHVLLTPGNYYEEGGYKDRGSKQKYYTGEIPDGYVLEKDDLLLAMTEQAAGLLGSPLLVPESDLYLHNQRLGLIEHLGDESISNRFLFHAFNTKSFREEIHNTGTGVKVRHTSPTKICDATINITFESKIQAEVVKTLENLKTKTETLILEYQTKLTSLDELKKSILQKAFAGELT